MTLNEARALIARDPSSAHRAAAEQLLNEALALPDLPSEQRDDAAIARIRHLDSAIPDYALRSFGTSVLESVGDSLTDPPLRKVAYAEALYLAQRYASGATSGGEGTARSRDAQEIEAKLRALEPASLPTYRDAIEPSDGSLPLDQAPLPGVAPPLPQQARRPAFLTAVGSIFIGAGAVAIPMSLFSSLMILGASEGTASARLFGGLVMIGAPAATLLAGIGLLRHWRWAYVYAAALLISFAAYNAVQLLRGSRPEVSTVAPDGVINTVLASNVNYPLHLLIIAICVGLLVKLLSPAIRGEFFRRALTS